MSNVIDILEQLRDRAVVSKFVSSRECQVYRVAIADAIDAVKQNDLEHPLDPDPE